MFGFAALVQKIFQNARKFRSEYSSNSIFFIGYNNRKCVNQVIGINKIRNTPTEYIENYQNHKVTQNIVCEENLLHCSLILKLILPVLKDFKAGGQIISVAEEYIEELIEKKK